MLELLTEKPGSPGWGEQSNTNWSCCSILKFLWQEGGAKAAGREKTKE